MRLLGKRSIKVYSKKMIWDWKVQRSSVIVIEIV